MSQAMNAHETLHARLIFAGSLDHPSTKLERSLIEEHGQTLHELAVALAQLAECRKSMTRMHEDLMTLLVVSTTLAEVSEAGMTAIAPFLAAYGPG